MPLYDYRALANGMSTGHPIPGLPFADDSHIPVDDPDAVEAVGRHPGGETWGRHDPVRQQDGGGWVAYTTDPRRHDLAWLVRWHPDHGRSVVLYRDTEAAAVHTAYQAGPLLYRAGGYWWDGTAWYRPDQVVDLAGGEYYHRPVPAAATVTAASLLDAGDGNPARGTVLDIADIDPDAPYEDRWDDDLALWASRRPGLDPATSVVTLTAPELAADRLVSAPEMAAITGIAASTLRAYASRSEADIPLPQAVIGGRAMWSRPVASDWAEQRQRSPEGVAEAVAVPGPGGHPVPVGEAELAAGLARSFHAALWDYRPFRGRWALRWRNASAVREVADSLAASAAGYILRSLIPGMDLLDTIARAVLYEFADWQRSEHAGSARKLRVASPQDADDTGYYPVGRPVARMLGWLVRHQPAMAQAAWGVITRDAEDKLGIPPSLTERSLDMALGLDGKLDEATLGEFLRRVKTPDVNAC